MSMSLAAEIKVPSLITSTTIWPVVIPNMSFATGIVISILCQVFANQDVPKVIVSSNFTHFSSKLFEDFCRGINIFLLHSSPNLNGLDEQLFDNAKEQILVSRGEETAEEELNRLKSRYWTTLDVGVQIRVSHYKNLISQYAALIFEPKANPAEICLDSCDLLPSWNSGTPEIQLSRRLTVNP
ncbi:hypothetical protein ACTXT7_016160 [Hymenolepis weldensis]